MDSIQNYNIVLKSRYALLTRTYKVAAGLLAEAEESADGFGVGFLHQQLNDGLSVGFNQVPALSCEGGGQDVAHLLHSLHDLFLIIQTICFQPLELNNTGRYIFFNKCHHTSDV